MRIIDLHNHTKFSYDGQNSPKEIVENAISYGISEVGISDHQFSIGDRIFEYLDELTRLKSEYKNDIDVKIGLEIGTRPAPNDFIPSISESLDYCLFESLDSKRAMDLYEFTEWIRLFKCPVGLAHTDIFALSERYRLDFIKLMEKNDIFWEINCSGNYSYYYDLISNKAKRDAVKNSNIKLSVGSDTHWIGDYNYTKVFQTNKLLEELGKGVKF